MLPVCWFLRPDSSQLPLPCVQNSRYLDMNRLEGILVALGFDKVKERWKANGKVDDVR